MDPKPAIRRTVPLACRQSVWSFTTTAVRTKCTATENPLRDEDYRWMLVDGFVNAFNKQRALFFEPSSELCVDESISRWNGQGGNWINLGLPQYVAIIHELENGCEIQNSACAQSGIMLRLRLVKTPEAEDPNELDRGMLHGAAIMKYLVEPWAHTGRFVAANSYFASVEATQVMDSLGFAFIAVVKTATRQYPMAYLSALELSNCGDCEGVITLAANGQPTMMAFVWMDHEERRYFIANTSSLMAGSPHSRQIAPVESNVAPIRTELEIPQPMACELFHSVAATIDRHNRSRQDTLKLERKLGMHNWSLRVNFSILSMHIVDTWLAWKGLGHCEEDETENLFYEYLAEDMIDNEYDTGERHQNQQQGVAGSHDAIGHDRSIGIYLTETKKKRRRHGVLVNQLAQFHCKVCKAKTSYVCNGCMESDPTMKEVYICHSKTGRDCFAKHKTAEHSALM